MWGKVIEGMENVDKIKRGEPVRNPDKIISREGRGRREVDALELERCSAQLAALRMPAAGAIGVALAAMVRMATIASLRRRLFPRSSRCGDSAIACERTPSSGRSARQRLLAAHADLASRCFWISWLPRKRDQILRSYPQLGPDDLRAALAYAAEVARERVIPVSVPAAP